MNFKKISIFLEFVLRKWLEETFRKVDVREISYGKWFLQLICSRSYCMRMCTKYWEFKFIKIEFEFINTRMNGDFISSCEKF